MKTCAKCKLERGTGDFAPYQLKHKYGWCRPCWSAYYNSRRDVYLAACKSYRESNPEKVRQTKRAYKQANRDRIESKRRASRLTIRGAARALLTQAKRSTVERNRRPGTPPQACTITFDFILGLLTDAMRHGVCPVLGLTFTLQVGGDMRGRFNPCRPSLDRIDPTRGYEPGNVRIVSLRANIGRSDLTAQELRLLAEDAERIEQQRTLRRDAAA